MYLNEEIVRAIARAWTPYALTMFGDKYSRALTEQQHRLVEHHFPVGSRVCCAFVPGLKVNAYLNARRHFGGRWKMPTAVVDKIRPDPHGWMRVIKLRGVEFVGRCYAPVWLAPVNFKNTLLQGGISSVCKGELSPDDFIAAIQVASTSAITSGD